MLQSILSALTPYRHDYPIHRPSGGDIAGNSRILDHYRLAAFHQ